MSIKLKKLVVKGENRPTKEIDFKLENTLIQGSSDTGKSYILNCVYYCLGGTDIPEDIGYSNGYTVFILTFSLNSKIYSIIRNYAFTTNCICEGEIYEEKPQKKLVIDKNFNDFFISNLGISDNKILVKSGKLGNITLSNLKHFSFFYEDKTLAKDFFISQKDKTKLIERRSLFSFLISNQDDKNLELSTSNDEKLRLDGKISVYKNELSSLKEWYTLNNFDIQTPIDSINEELFVLETLIESKMDLKISNQKTINELNLNLNKLRNNKDTCQLEINKLIENITNFHTLNQKYDSDKERLISILNAHLVFDNFLDHNCPICNSIIQENSLEKIEIIKDSIEYEIKKINVLQTELKNLIPDLEEELFTEELNLALIDEEINNNLSQQFQVKAAADLQELKDLTNRKNILENSIIVSEKIVNMDKLINSSLLIKNKRVKVVRELSTHYDKITTKCSDLLGLWGVAGINSLYISNEEMDLMINQRSRKSFGKGKRAIFLTAFAISLMQYSLETGSHHLGFLIIDSPLVTHKDPKHGIQSLDNNDDLDMEINDYTNISVAQKFYKWLTNYNGVGQIIIIENDAPNLDYMSNFNYIEFTGNEQFGRRGFY